MERESDVNPFLQGNFAPWSMEGTADDLQVIGEIPRDLNGTFYRNSTTRLADLTDGTTHTCLIGDRAWGNTNGIWAGAPNGGQARAGGNAIAN